jgi:hypothetical protein
MRYCLLLALVSASAVGATPGYELSINADRRDGNVTVGENRMASLSELSFTVGPRDRCQISVKVYEGDNLVASQSTDCAR